MKRNKILISIAALAAIISIRAMAPNYCASADKEVKQELRVAVFSVPDLSKNVAEDISKALAGEPGILSAKPDFGEKSFSVTYEPGKTGAEKIQKAMGTVVPETKLREVVAAQDKSGRHACGKCPGRKSCGRYKD
jgi:copper chaperone CopZ